MPTANEGLTLGGVADGALRLDYTFYSLHPSQSWSPPLSPPLPPSPSGFHHCLYVLIFQYCCFIKSHCVVWGYEPINEGGGRNCSLCDANELPRCLWGKTQLTWLTFKIKVGSLWNYRICQYLGVGAACQTTQWFFWAVDTFVTPCREKVKTRFGKHLWVRRTSQRQYWFSVEVFIFITNVNGLQRNAAFHREFPLKLKTLKPCFFFFLERNRKTHTCNGLSSVLPPLPSHLL